MMMPALNLFSPPKVTIKRRRYMLDDDDDNGTSTPATGTVTCDYNEDVHDNDHDYCPYARPTKRHRRCITPVLSLTNMSLFLPILEDQGQEASATTCTHQEERGFPPPSLPLAYRQEEEEDERRDGAGRVSPSNYFDETTPFLQPKKQKSLQQQQYQEEGEQQYDIEQGQEQQGSSRCCYLNPFVYSNNSNNSNPSPAPRMMINKSTVQRKRHTPRRVLPTPSPFLPFSSSPVTTHNIDDTIVEQFQRAIRLSSEEQDEEELLSTTAPSPPTTTIKTPSSFDLLRY